MGLLKLFGMNPTASVPTPAARKLSRHPQVEPLEKRELLAADLAPEVLLGGVYFEEATGDDSEADILQISFVGGPTGTTLDNITISGDKFGDGLSSGDIFFDTEAGGIGVFSAVGLSVIESDGFTIDSVSVADGGTDLTFTFSGFEAGERLVFSIDADEAQAVNPTTGEVRLQNSLVEGAEWELNTLVGWFTAPGYVDLVLGNLEGDEYYDDFDGRRADAETDVGLTLDLPNDRYELADNKIDRSAGAVSHAPLIPLASISGHVYHDRSDDGIFDTETEEGISDVEIELLDENGVGLGIFATTNGDGYYEFLNLAAGKYGVREVAQPTPYLDGKDTAGSHDGVAGNEIITGAMLDFGDQGINYNFGELLPGSISGRVHVDTDGDCDFDEPDLPLAGVVIELLDANGGFITSVTTDEEGRYRFDNLTPGEYQIREIQPAKYLDQNLLDGDERVGDAGGVLSNDLITGIKIGSDQHAVDYDFCEHLVAMLSGYVYHDQNDDGVFDTTEKPIEGVELKLLKDGQDTGRRALTNDKGFYKFNNLDPGKYTVMEVQPDDWYDGQDTPGTLGGDDSVNDMIAEIMLTYGSNSEDNNFGELLGGSIAGRVHADLDGDCDFENPDRLLGGVDIDLLDADGNYIRTEQTNELGEYKFENLAPGEYQVREHTPEGYYDGDERLGTAGGVLSDDLVTGIVIGSDQHATQYDFCEHVGAELSGYVYHDENNDGLFDPSESPIVEVELKLLDADGNDTGLRAETNNDGYYKFTNLEAGKYTVMEVHPAGWLDGKDTVGTTGGDNSVNDMLSSIMLAYGQKSLRNNFGELLPGSIRGSVHVSTDPDCDPHDGEPPIPDVEIQLLNEAGEVIEVTYTNEEGEYEFINLPPGVYSVREIQPEGYFDGDHHVGTGSGSYFGEDTIGDIHVGSDQHWIHYDFCETPPAALSGYVFIDGAPIVTLETIAPEDVASYGDGARTSDDTPLAGITLELRHGRSGDPIFAEEALPGYYPEGPIRTTTDANGYYRFDGLQAGTYAVVEIQPEGLIDGIDTVGSLGGTAINAEPPLGGEVIPFDDISVGELTIEQFRTAFGNNAIVRISLAVGQESIENNFSEVRAQPFFFPPEDPPADPPPVIPPGPMFTLSTLPQQFYNAPQTPPPIYGASQTLGWTWHLSVVNAGRPRAAVATGPTMVLAKNQFDARAWENGQLDMAEWTLMQDDAKRERLQHFVFGDNNGIPVVGDWNGDGVSEIGVFVEGYWYLDLNGNGNWDRGDLWARLGSETDLPVTGDWDGDGKDDIGIYGPAWPRDPHAIAREPGLPDADNYPTILSGKAKNVPPTPEDATSGGRLLRRTSAGRSRADLIDHVFHYGTPGDQPIAGDWNGDGIRTIGVFRDGVWSLDTDGDGRVTAKDASIVFGMAGDVAVVGDWDGDGIDDLGVFRAGRWLVDSNGDRELDARDTAFELGSAGDKPIAGDWDGDGADEPAVYGPRTGEVRVSQKAG